MNTTASFAGGFLKLLFVIAVIAAALIAFNVGPAIHNWETSTESNLVGNISAPVTAGIAGINN